MPKCVLCDSGSFDVVDGLYFCTDCGTQSQDVQEEVAGDVVQNGRLEVRKRKIKKSKDFGKPWFTYEGYQLIIKKQVEFLISIGVNPKLKDVVGQIWFKFVKKSTPSVFNINNCEMSKDKQTRHVEARRKKRDDVGIFVPFDSTNRPLPKGRNRQDEDVDALELSSEIAREEFYEDDDPTAVLFDNDSSDSDNEQLLGEVSDVGSIKLNVSSGSSFIGYTTISHTLAFCHLGLMWLEEPICISDLVRWASNGHLPYHNASSFFPSYMKFSKADGQVFCGADTPQKINIYTLSHRLLKYIDMPALPKQDIRIHIARYAIDLQLPASVHRYVQSVAKKVEYEPVILPNYDDLALVYIVLSLKLIYGLDGKTEHELAELAVEIPEDDKSSYFPVWNDMIEVISTCHTACVKGSIPVSTEDMETFKDVRNYAQFCREKVFGSWQAPFAVDRVFPYLRGRRGLTSEKLKEYGNVFSMCLTQDETGDGSSNMTTPLSFPFVEGRRRWLEVEEKQRTSGKQVKNNINCDPGTESIPFAATTNPFERITRRGISQEAVIEYYRKRKEKDGRSRTFCSYKLPKVGYWGKLLKKNVSKAKRQECWNECVLPNSLKNLFDICSKLAEVSPLLLHTSLRNLEDNLVNYSEGDEGMSE